MGFYRKRPKVVEAFQFTANHTNTDPSVPSWFVDVVLSGGINTHPDHIDICTFEGIIRADPGDWIVKGIKGELYPVKPDIFAASYEECDPPEASFDFEAPGQDLQASQGFPARD
jgi:hypothetical protein